MATYPQDENPDGNLDELWPSADYADQVEQLRQAIGETIYLVELHGGSINLSVSLTGEAFVLLDVLAFPRPDPSRGILPHLLLLDDGRGINLGRVARVSRRPFSPVAGDILYLDAQINAKLLFAEQRLSKQWIAQRSRQLLARVLGKEEPLALARHDRKRLDKKPE